MPPTGFKRSRALWDHALTRQHASKSQEARSWLRAIAYELQPTRSSIEWKTEWGLLQRVQGLLKWLLLLLETAPRILQRCYVRSSEMTLRHWMIVACVFGYYLFVRLAHETLQAGPLVLIVTALVLIFTVGLGDKDDEEGELLSAYSVFNRGFQQLLGTMDAEELAAQHVGGGGMMMMMGGGGAIMRHHHHQLPPPAEEVENDRPAALMGAANDNNDDQQPVQAPPQQQQAANGGGNNRRVTGKKARRRRRDPEQRREMQRQRQAAAALGGNDDDDDAVAMQLLIEEQIIRNNNQ